MYNYLKWVYIFLGHPVYIIYINENTTVKQNKNLKFTTASFANEGLSGEILFKQNICIYVYIFYLNKIYIYIHIYIYQI